MKHINLTYKPEKSSSRVRICFVLYSFLLLFSFFLYKTSDNIYEALVFSPVFAVILIIAVYQTLLIYKLRIKNRYHITYDQDKITVQTIRKNVTMYWIDIDTISMSKNSEECYLSMETNHNANRSFKECFIYNENDTLYINLHEFTLQNEERTAIVNECNAQFFKTNETIGTAVISNHFLKYTYIRKCTAFNGYLDIEGEDYLNMIQPLIDFMQKNKFLLIDHHSFTNNNGSMLLFAPKIGVGSVCFYQNNWNITINLNLSKHRVSKEQLAPLKQLIQIKGLKFTNFDKCKF